MITSTLIRRARERHAAELAKAIAESPRPAPSMFDRPDVHTICGRRAITVFPAGMNDRDRAAYMRQVCR